MFRYPGQYVQPVRSNYMYPQQQNVVRQGVAVQRTMGVQGGLVQRAPIQQVSHINLQQSRSPVVRQVQQVQQVGYQSLPQGFS